MPAFYCRSTAVAVAGVVVGLLVLSGAAYMFYQRSRVQPAKVAPNPQQQFVGTVPGPS